jgi:Ca2+/Na+ antiporter
LPVEEEHFHHYYTYVWCIFGPAFLFLTTLKFTLISYILTGSFSLILLIIFWSFQRNLETKKTIPRCFLLMNLLSVLSGMLWTYHLISILVDLLNSIGMLLRLTKVYIGLTVLAVGNALPDALTTIALAK